MQKVKISELHLWAKNPRTIKDKRFEALCKSLTDDPSFMELRPILATKDGRIYAGNMRYRAAKELGWTEVPAIITDIPEKLANERAIKDNNEFGEWNNDELATILDEMEKQGTDISTLGLDEQINKIIEQLNEKEIVEDEVPAVKKDPQTVLGDLWILGSHRLLCGDATKIDDVERLMDGQKADIMVTDPPYNVEYEGNYIQSGDILKKADKIWSGGIANDNRDDFGAWLSIVFSVCDVALDNGASIYIWHPPGEDGKYFWQSWPFDKWHFQVDLVWNKTSLIISRWDYKPQHEPCMYGWKGKNRNWAGANNEPTVWDIPRQQGNSGGKRDHPTQKPVECMARAIRNHPSKIVYDCFGGSGSTLIACEQLNRKCYMMELDPQYVRVIIDRWEKLTGKKAVLQ